MTALDTISASAAPIGAAGAAFYFAPATLARGKELGLDGFRFYVLGRGGVLGDVAPPVVQSAFGYFTAAVIDKIWTSAAEKVAPREAGRIYHECCAEHGRATAGDVEGLAEFVDAAETVVAAADPAALALFAGIAAEPLADDLPGRAAQLAAVLRELRGSAHLVALLAAGLSPAVAHCVKRPEMAGAFGYETPLEGAADHAERAAAAEELTDQLLVPAYSTLTDAQGAALVAGAVALEAAMVAS
ncbi:MAG: SCO6745 family protein [Acidimicrobiales bacterium]